MRFNRESAVERAKKDLAERLNVAADEIETSSVVEKDFSDMSLGAAAAGEMAAQMISSGWQINLHAAGQSYEYRADKYQLRLLNYKGANYLIEG
ncbi:MAG: hypothetical protein M3T96_11285 [Acidobacteriota bacterium]|nr:hypothetical protein [Acidobacteriota bacterium]